MSLKFHFAHDIYHARTNRTDDHKLTQQQVADAALVSLRQYQKNEKGEVLPGTETFLCLAFFFELDIKAYREDIFDDSIRSL